MTSLVAVAVVAADATRGGRYTEAAAAASINFTVGYFFKGDNFHGKKHL